MIIGASDELTCDSLLAENRGNEIQLRVIIRRRLIMPLVGKLSLVVNQVQCYRAVHCYPAPNHLFH